MRTFVLSELIQLCPDLKVNDCKLHTFNGVSVDSRNVTQGNLFFCLPGHKVDGHHFLNEASKQGALAAIVHESYQGPSFGLTLIYAKDVLSVLQTLASDFVKRGNQKIVGITGSVGKTTTKTFLYDILKSKYKTIATPQNYNSQIGLPLTILNHSFGDEEFFVLEMAMTDKGQIGQLVEIAPPDFAVITKVALVHAHNFSSVDEIAMAKTEILSHPKTKEALIDYAILKNFFQSLKRYGHVSTQTFSIDTSDADYYIDSNEDFLWVNHRDHTENYGLYPFLWKHHKHNLLAAIITAKKLGMSIDEIAKVVPTLSLPDRRMEICHRAGITFVNDSYNASPIAVRAALENLPQPSLGGIKIAVLGEMLELGSHSEASHREIGEHALKYVDVLYCFGEGCFPILEVWKKAGKPVYFSEQRSGLIPYLTGNLKVNDIVLLKGSCSKEVWKIMDAFDEETENR